jgi:IS30 family transposase
MAFDYLQFKKKAKHHIKRIQSNKNFKAISRDVNKVLKPTINREIKRVRKARSSNQLFRQVDF